eukprot:11087740-Alexandrium_andersonii.AAC.1
MCIRDRTGSSFVAALAAQAQYARSGIWAQPPTWTQLLGRSLDLLVWIPKTPGADTPASLRPLQIPNCWRRLVGATLAAVLGPLLEPL